MRHSGKTAIVTGGTGALGRVCVGRLFDIGLNIGIPHTSEKSLDRIPDRVSKNTSRLLTAVANLTLEDQVGSFVDQVVQKFGSVEYLVNTAGGYLGGHTIDEVSGGDWEGIMALNMKTTFLMSRSVLKIMKRRSFGRIVNMAAMAALSSGAKKGAYAISKRGVITLTETIADETKGTGITANAIAPSIILTEANRQSMPSANYSSWVTPEEIADLVIYLCSDEAKSISGNTIKIYGGV